MTNQNAAGNFAVYCEVDGHLEPLLMFDLTFARLIDDVVVPLENQKPFFVDGVPVTKGPALRRLKILRQSEEFQHEFGALHWELRAAHQDKREFVAANYHRLLEGLVRESCEDVTSQVVKAFDTAIRPSLKDYIPRRQDLIDLAAKMFGEGLKALGGYGRAHR